MLLNKEPSLVTGLSHTAFGGNSNPEESGGSLCKYRNSGPTGIPAKNSCESGWKQEFSRPLQNHVPVKKFLRKKKKKGKKRNPQESWQERGLGWGSKKWIPENMNKQPSSAGLSWKCRRFRCRPQLVLTTCLRVFLTRRPDTADVSATSCDVGFFFSVSYVVSLPTT